MMTPSITLMPKPVDCRQALYDAVHAVTGSTPNIPGARPGMRAAELADAALDTESGFLANLGRPSRVRLQSGPPK